MKLHHIYTLVMGCLGYLGHTQISFDYQIPGNKEEWTESYLVDTQMPPDVLDAYLKSIKAKEIVFDTAQHPYYFKVRLRKGWQLYYHDDWKTGEEYYDSVAFPRPNADYFLVKEKRKFGVHSISGDAPTVWYDKVMLRKPTYHGQIAWVKKDDTWGVFGLDRQVLLQPHVFEDTAEIPKGVQYAYFPDNLDQLREELSIDIIQPDPNNGDGIFKVRHNESQKYGLIQLIGKPEIFIPMEYDSLYYFAFNGNFTPVFNKGMVGFYVWGKWDKPIPCLYEDYFIQLYKTSRLSPTYEQLLVKKDGKWGAIDWFTGEQTFSFTYNTKEDVPLPIRPSEYYRQ